MIFNVFLIDSIWLIIVFLINLLPANNTTFTKSFLNTMMIYVTIEMFFHVQMEEVASWLF